MAEEKKQLLIVTGMSGAGKTVVAHALEDMATLLLIICRRLCSEVFGI